MRQNSFIETLSQVSNKGILYASWAHTVEPVSLGGLLVFRQELESIAQTLHLTKIHVQFERKFQDKVDFIKLVFAASGISFTVEFVECCEALSFHWPHFIEEGSVSYQSFKRINMLYENLGWQPCLNWHEKILASAKKIRNSLKKKLITVHLKQVGKDPTESNANLKAWHDFFVNKTTADSNLGFIALGEDVSSQSLGQIKNVVFAATLQVPIMEQLALITLSNGFLGMASGICQAAIFSKVPYVIFKHPQHHVQEMKAEIGDRDHFLFSGEKQFFWRKLDTLKNLEQAFNLLEIL